MYASSYVISSSSSPTPPTSSSLDRRRRAQSDGSSLTKFVLDDERRLLLAETTACDGIPPPGITKPLATCSVVTLSTTNDPNIRHNIGIFIVVVVVVWARSSTQLNCTYRLTTLLVKPHRRAFSRDYRYRYMSCHAM
mmetsp:Transcript_32798/g.72328  ORF Transcript_32798/g.72328 Transcript_32798/m.72328 type:complete len:137 (-) Transcript_32798:47-457(-)